MTTPNWGNQIALSDVNNEVGWGNPHQLGMDWVRAVGKTGVGGNVNVFSDFNNMHDKAWYQNNNQGNCNNGNCTSNCNCGNIQCNDCVISGTVNCANCDGQAYLQPNCNCACTYNCTTSNTSYNCNCNCDCFVCACACW